MNNTGFSNLLGGMNKWFFKEEYKVLYRMFINAHGMVGSGSLLGVIMSFSSLKTSSPSLLNCLFLLVIVTLIGLMSNVYIEFRMEDIQNTSSGTTDYNAKVETDTGILCAITFCLAAVSTVALPILLCRAFAIMK